MSSGNAAKIDKYLINLHKYYGVSKYIYWNLILF